MIKTKDTYSTLPQWRVFTAVAAMCVVILLAVLASFLFATPLDGPGDSAAQHLDTGWFYLQDGTAQPIETLPYTIDVKEKPLLLRRQLTEEDKRYSRYVLTLRSRYASVRVWADDLLVYEAAQGKEHALGSMWHFIPMERCNDAQWITIELYPYGSSEYTVDHILLDSPGAIRYELMMDNLFALLYGSGCLILVAVMLVAVILLAVWKSSTYAPMLAFMLFLLLSGSWILLDSKITTLGGGNYAISYFLSYAAFYLMLAPLLAYVRSMTKDCGRLLSVLIWASIVNAGVSFLLHMTGFVQLYRTTIFVHILIVLSLPVSTMALWKSVIQRRETHLRCFFVGMIAVYVFGLISIALYYLDLLPEANSTQLYTIGLSMLVAGMTIDTVASFGRFWRERDMADWYRHLAMIDSMTELENRNAFQIHLTSLIKRQPAIVAFIVFDVDSLKQINDQMGHYMGDQAIHTAAQCIQTVFGHVGGCYRIGGDEFAVIMDGPLVSAIPALLERFTQEVLLQWDNRLPSCGVSYGWASAAFSKKTPVTIERLVQLQAEADRSLYQQKQGRKAHKKAPHTAP